MTAIYLRNPSTVLQQCRETFKRQVQESNEKIVVSLHF